MSTARVPHHSALVGAFVTGIRIVYAQHTVSTLYSGAYCARTGVIKSTHNTRCPLSFEGPTAHAQELLGQRTTLVVHSLSRGPLRTHWRSAALVSSRPSLSLARRLPPWPRIPTTDVFSSHGGLSRHHAGHSGQGLGYGALRIMLAKWAGIRVQSKALHTLDGVL